MIELFTIVDKVIALKPVRWLLLIFTLLFLVTSLWLGLRVKLLTAELKKIKADLAWVQSALSLQNEAVQQAAKETEKLREQKRVKAQEAATAKATAAERAEEIMRLKMSKDCAEVSKWGVERGQSQGRW